MLREFIPVLFSIGVAVAIAVGAIVVALILGKVGQRNKGKDLAYECGKDPIGGGSARFSVKFYLVAMIFILFDIEVIFMYPWAVVYRDFLAQQGPVIFWSMAGFVSVLTIGYVYAIKKGALDWRN